MSLPLRYSIQKSSLKPQGVTEEYIRLQVKLRAEQNRIIISNADYNMILQALSEGRLVGVSNEAGVSLGQFQTGLAGGGLASNFTSPITSDVQVSFKPAKQFLKEMRELVSFEQIPTVDNDPKITAFTFLAASDDTQTKYTNKIQLGTSGILKVTGTHFVKQGMQVKIVQKNGNNDEEVILSAPFTSGSKMIEVLINSTDLPSNKFQSGIIPAPGYTRLIASRLDNLSRSSFINFEFIPANVSPPVSP